MRAAATILLLLALPPVLAGEDEPPPTPQERIAAMKAECAEQRAKLGKWAAEKKLGDLAPAQYRLALRLDPDCRTARSKLGFRRAKDGGWEPPRREKEWKLDPRALEKHGGDFTDRERILLEAELFEFEELGKALIAEGETEPGRRLCLRVHLLAPEQGGAAKALGLVPLGHRFAEPEVAEAVEGVPKADIADAKGPLAEVLGIETVVRACGPVVAETVRDADAAAKLARRSYQAEMLTARRFQWANLARTRHGFSICDEAGRFQRFLVESKLFDSAMIAAAKAARCGRAGGRYALAVCCALPGESPHLWLPNCVHMAAEDVLTYTLGGRTPAWIGESAAVDAVVTLLGHQGPLCCVLEESAGLEFKDRLDDPAAWGRLLLRRIGLEDLPPVLDLVRRSLNALSTTDILVAHALYRYLHRTQRENLWPYVRESILPRRDPVEVFTRYFGKDLEEKWIGLLAGAD